MAGALAARGVGRGDVVMTVVGNRPEWVYAMLACWRIGAVAQPCTEQLRPARPARAHGERGAARRRGRRARPRPGGREPASTGPCWPCRTSACSTHEPVPAAELRGRGPGADRLHLRHRGRARSRCATATATSSGQSVQAEHWYGARPGDLCWCTAASGWSLSARNAFVAAWLRGAAALLHDARFDPEERLELVERERVNVLCMSPTEYRAIAKRVRAAAARRRSATPAPPASRSTPRWCARGRRAPGVSVHDGYGQTETGHLTGMPIGPPVRPGSMGRPLPGVRAWIDDGELVVDPATVPDLLPRRRRATGPGAPATACARTRTATSGSRAGPTT